MITTTTKKSYTNWMGGKKKANILRCVVIQMKIKINLKAPKWVREEKNDFHVCEIKVSSSFISGWFVEPRRLCACVYMKNMSRTLLLPLRSVYFFSLIHSEISYIIPVSFPLFACSLAQHHKLQLSCINFTNKHTQTCGYY